METETPPHAAALDRLGYGPIKSHFNVTRRAWQYWRLKGVPRMHIKSVAILMTTAGLPTNVFLEAESHEQR